MTRLVGAVVASAFELRSFERAHGVHLPLSYADFLRKRGGGTPEPNCFLDQKRGLCLFVGLIFPLTDERMSEQRFAFPPSRESGYLTIGASGGGDYYLIDLGAGEVFYWDHERNDVFLQREDMTWLSPSVGSLVDSLVCPLGGADKEPGVLEALGRDGSAEEVDAFLRTRHLTEKNAAGRSLAEEAARHGNLDVVRRCVELGSSLRNLLHFTASGRNTDLVRYLLDAGAGVNELNALGQTPLDRATDQEVYELLVRSGGVHAKRSRPPHFR